GRSGVATAGYAPRRTHARVHQWRRSRSSDQDSERLCRRERPLRWHWAEGRARQATARDHHTQALAIARDIGAPLEQARAMEGLGQNHFQDGRLGKAPAYLRQAVAIYRQIGAPAPGASKNPPAPPDDPCPR